MSLFGNENINQDLKYSKILEQFIESFSTELTDAGSYEDIIDFAINAWNFGNMKLLLPKGESDAMINSLDREEVDVDLLKKMINSKVTKFKDHKRFIVDFDFDEAGESPILSVITKDKDGYLASMMDNFDEEYKDEDFSENYTDRKAITLTPLQPFLDWCSNLYPKRLNEKNSSKTYLLTQEIEDVEAWLSKKFDKLFTLELEERDSNKKAWPKNRNYEMFKQWFQIQLSEGVYDLEKEPVFKF